MALTWSDEIIDPEALRGNGGGGGSDLPEVTTDDNGKVLKVIAGAWGKGDDNDSGFPITELVPAYSTNTTVSSYYLTGDLVSYKNPALLSNDEPKIYRAKQTVYKQTNGEFDEDDWDQIPTYDTTETYNYPDYVEYNGSLYQAKQGQTDITGEWDSSKWDSKFVSPYSEFGNYTQGSLCKENNLYYEANTDIVKSDRAFQNAEWDEISYDVAIREWNKPFKVARYEIKTGDTSTTDSDGLLKISTLVGDFGAMIMTSTHGYLTSIIGVKAGTKTYPGSITNDVSIELVSKTSLGLGEYIRFRKKDGTLYTSTALTSILPVGSCLMFYAFNLFNANEFETFKDYPVSN